MYRVGGLCLCNSECVLQFCQCIFHVGLHSAYSIYEQLNYFDKQHTCADMHYLLFDVVPEFINSYYNWQAKGFCILHLFPQVITALFHLFEVLQCRQIKYLKLNIINSSTNSHTVHDEYANRYYSTVYCNVPAVILFLTDKHTHHSIYHLQYQ